MHFCLWRTNETVKKWAGEGVDEDAEARAKERVGEFERCDVSSLATILEESLSLLLC